LEPVSLFLGWRVAVLGLAVVQMLMLAAAVASQSVNARANRLLAAFLVVLAGVLAPYVIGFAGFYDAWPWLTFAPLAIPLALPPLLYAYAHALVTGRPPDRFGLHLGPPLLQLLYLGVGFALPMQAKWDWYTGGHGTLVSPLLDALLMVSLGAYAWASLRLLRSYRKALSNQRSDGDRFATGWLSRVIVALVLTLALHFSFALWDSLAGGLSFFQQTGLYLALGAIGLYLGVEGWRHASVRFPNPVPEPQIETTFAPDWSAIGTDYDARVRAAGWASEPDLSLPVLARRLATNTARLSRAINLGLGVNFSTWINGLRAEAVARSLDDGATEDLLTLALDAGFTSKASFNRAFLARFGIAPSRYRRGGVSQSEFSSETSNVRRVAVTVRAG